MRGFVQSPQDRRAACKAEHEVIITIAEQKRQQRKQFGSSIGFGNFEATRCHSGFGGNEFEFLRYSYKEQKVLTCYSCQQSGHISKECPIRRCLRCQQTGHSKNDCPNEEYCKRCKTTGHVANDCPTSSCSNCDSWNHVTSACSRPSRCRRCKQEGHELRDCPKPALQKKCRRCFATDHLLAHCLEPVKCFRCQQINHEAANCTNVAVPRQIVDHDGNTHDAVLYVPKPIPEEEMWKLHISPGQRFAYLTTIEATRKGNGVEAIPILDRFDDDNAEELLGPKLRENLKRMGYVQPTAIQKNGIPVVLDGRDLRAHAQTGSGKTACFMVPILHRILTEFPDDLNKPREPYALIVSPTRELAQQIYCETIKFANGTGVKALVSHGGVMVTKEVSSIQKGISIIIMTPGRMKHFVRNGVLNLRSIITIVFDECDSILESGFEEEVNILLSDPSLPHSRQLLLFSATFHDEVKDVANKYSRDPIIIEIGVTGSVCSDVKQSFMQLDTQHEKDERLLELLKPDLDEYCKNPSVMESKKVIIFVERRGDADFLTDTLNDKLHSSKIGQKVQSLSGAKSQEERDQVMRTFREGNLPIIVATALAARGIDIQNVDHVINYDLPNHIDDYVHRVGRTGRIGNGGRATSFFTMDKDSDLKLAGDLVKVMLEVQQEPPEFLVEIANKSRCDFLGKKKGWLKGCDRCTFTDN